MLRSMTFLTVCLETHIKANNYGISLFLMPKITMESKLKENKIYVKDSCLYL